jgi:cytoskeletal protein CcmA (bactofilin family)
MALFNKESSAREPEAARSESKPESTPQPSLVQPAGSKPENGAPPAKPASFSASEAFAPRKPSSEARALLDQGCKISGKLEFEEAARIDGQVDGEIIARSNLVIGESAVVKAQITASSIIVAGTLSGEIAASQRIEIHASAKVSGNVTTPKLIVHEGAIFEGYCSMSKESASKERKIEPVGEKRPFSSRVQDQKQAS